MIIFLSQGNSGSRLSQESKPRLYDNKLDALPTALHRPSSFELWVTIHRLNLIHSLGSLKESLNHICGTTIETKLYNVYYSCSLVQLFVYVCSSYGRKSEYPVETPSVRVDEHMSIPHADAMYQNRDPSGERRTRYNSANLAIK